MGFAVGHFYDIKLFEDTFLDKQAKKDKIIEENLILQKELDSLKKINVNLKGQLE